MVHQKDCIDLYKSLTPLLHLLALPYPTQIPTAHNHRHDLSNTLIGHHHPLILIQILGGPLLPLDPIRTINDDNRLAGRRGLDRPQVLGRDIRRDCRVRQEDTVRTLALGDIGVPEYLAVESAALKVEGIAGPGFCGWSDLDADVSEVESPVPWEI